jgi:poly(3-hydroxyoctanoate) depolymerase
LSGPTDIELFGRRVHVTIRGDGRPVLLINGLGANVGMWAAFEAHLSGMQVIAFDAPGCGGSEPWPFPWIASTGTLARAVTILLDRLGYDRVDVVGYSFGGVVAQQLARTSPASVGRLVLIGTSVGWGSVPPAAPVALAMSTPLRYRSRRLYAATAPLLDRDAACRPRHDDPAVRARFADPPSIKGYMSQLAAASMFTSLPWLHRIGHPTLVVAGEEDRVVPAVNSVLLASRLPKGRLLTFPGEGHYLLLDKASTAGPAVAEYLSATTPGRSSTWRAARTVGSAEAAAAVARSALRGPQTWLAA